MSESTAYKVTTSLLYPLDNCDEEKQTSSKATRSRPVANQHEREQASLEAIKPGIPIALETSRLKTPLEPDTRPKSPSPNAGPQSKSNFTDRSPTQRPLSLALSLSEGLGGFSHLLDHGSMPQGSFQKESNAVSGDGAEQSAININLALPKRRSFLPQRIVAPDTRPKPEIPLKSETLPKPEPFPKSETPSIHTSTTTLATTTWPVTLRRLEISARPKTFQIPEAISKPPKSLLETVYPTNEALVCELELGDLDYCVEKLRIETNKRGGGRQAREELEAATNQLKFLEQQVLEIELSPETKRLDLVGGVGTVFKLVAADARNSAEVNADREEKEKAASIADFLPRLSKIPEGRRQKFRELGKQLAGSGKKASMGTGWQELTTPKVSLRVSQLSKHTIAPSKIKREVDKTLVNKILESMFDK